MLISKFGTISKETITEFEDANDIKLPEQYRRFIELYNGGETPHTSFSLNGVSSDLKGLYGIGKVKYSFDLVQKEEVKGVCYLPIGMDSFGNDIMIDLCEGAIFFKDHENGGIKKIAPDLKEFVHGCESRVINKSAVKSVEEREKELIARGRGGIITNALRDMWRAEINKYGAISQEEVIL